MLKVIVKYQFDSANLPQLTNQQQSELAALKTAPDHEIDHSDIPLLDESF